MRFKQKSAIAVFLALGLLPVAVASIGQVFWWGYRSTEPASEVCETITRKHYPFRHWLWSGIFPVEGGFIPDPHYAWSEIMPASDPVRQASGATCYQLVDVNPSFDDSSSEIVLLIRSSAMSHEYSLNVPKGQGVLSVLASPAPPNAVLFPYRGKLAPLAHFFGPAKGIYLLHLPLERRGSLNLIPVKSAQFSAIATEFGSVGKEHTIRTQFCKAFRLNPFIAFYEKHCGPCEGEVLSNSDVEDKFAEFWYKE